MSNVSDRDEVAPTKITDHESALPCRKRSHGNTDHDKDVLGVPVSVPDVFNAAFPFLVLVRFLLFPVSFLLSSIGDSSVECTLLQISESFILCKLEGV